ncbi:MAG: tyrosine-type recombinase/integrase [Actinomycetota bacterium]|nr:tyrosine-type recombinase/integrase [Actinomycetota bacterium]
MTFHDPCHACTSHLFQKTVHPKFVQELLGHDSIAITLDTYSHLIPGTWINTMRLSKSSSKKTRRRREVR